MTPESASNTAAAVTPRQSNGLRSMARVDHNLPVQLSSFIGRERELEQLSTAIGKHRLVTLTGPGGVGKTRLAVELALRISAIYRDGVWLVEFGNLGEPDLVPQAVASVLGVRERFAEELSQRIVDFLRDRCLLLILDNCEHLLEPSARLTDALLRACPYVTVLTTSRQPLGIQER